MVGKSLPVVATPAANGSIDMAVLMQQSAQKIGLTLNVNRVPADGYWSNHWMKHPLGFGNINPRPSADQLMTQFFKSDATWNESGWKNEQFDQLVLAARSETDEAKRKQMYGDMQVLIHEKCGIGIPVFLSFLEAHSSKVKGLGSIPIGPWVGYMFTEHAARWRSRARVALGLASGALARHDRLGRREPGDRSDHARDRSA